MNQADRNEERSRNVRRNAYMNLVIINSVWGTIVIIIFIINFSSSLWSYQCNCYSTPFYAPIFSNKKNIHKNSRFSSCRTPRTLRRENIRRCSKPAVHWWYQRIYFHGVAKTAPKGTSRKKPGTGQRYAMAVDDQLEANFPVLMQERCPRVCTFCLVCVRCCSAVCGFVNLCLLLIQTH